MASITHILPLSRLPVNKSAPATLILHGKFGDCIGNVAPYDFFTMGGPSSSRGYEIGEIGSTRTLLEAAAEIRYPLCGFDGQVYSFLEHSNSMGSGVSWSNNPIDFFRLNGSGTSWGYGFRFGVTRLEYARDCNMGRGTWFVRF